MNIEPTRGLKPRTPSLRVAYLQGFLAYLRSLGCAQMRWDGVISAEFGRKFGTKLERFCAHDGSAGSHVRIPVGTTGGSVTVVGGGSGLVPDTLRLLRKTQRTSPSGRAAEAARSAGVPFR